MVAPQLGEELEDTDPRRARAARLPGGPVRGLSSVHRRPADGRAREVPVFPRRGALGPEATQPATVVEHRTRLAGPVSQAASRDGSPLINSVTGRHDRHVARPSWRPVTPPTAFSPTCYSPSAHPESFQPDLSR